MHLPALIVHVPRGFGGKFTSDKINCRDRLPNNEKP